MNSAEYAERVWIGPGFASSRILVLGESWYGDYEGDLVTDDGYIRAYLDGTIVDAMYTRLANATGLGKQAFWRNIMFTNFVQRVGSLRDARPTPTQYRAATQRLASLLVVHRPLGVWILGKEQSRHSEPVVMSAGIAAEVAPHPTSYGVRNAVLRESWSALLAKTGPEKQDSWVVLAGARQASPAS